MTAEANPPREALRGVYAATGDGFGGCVFILKKDRIAELISAYEIADIRKLMQQLRVVCQPKPGVAVVQAKAKNLLCAARSSKSLSQLHNRLRR